MTPYRESEKLNKRSLAVNTKRLVAEHGSVAKPLHETLPSSLSSPGATQAKVKEEVVSPSAANFSPWRPILRRTKSLGDCPHRSNPQNYTTAWDPLNEKLSQAYQPSAVPLQAPTMTLPPPAVPEQPRTIPYQSSATPYSLRQHHITLPQYHSSLAQYHNNLQQYHANLQSYPCQPPPAPLIYAAVPNRYLNLSEVSGAQNSKSQLQNNDQPKQRLEKH